LNRLAPEFIIMWKIVVGFILFAALSIWVLMQGGDSLDMGGEKHSTEAHAPAAVDPPVAASAAKP
jgi:hypothetical protein